MNALFGWFDLLTITMIALGVVAGRRRGMSAELLSLLMWLGIVLGGAEINPAVGRWFARNLGLGPTWSCIFAYLFVAVLLSAGVFLLRRRLGDKLVSGDAFGGFEYYLGMVAGVVRFLCMLLFVMALVYAPRIADSEVQARVRAQRESLGSVYFPPFGQVQRSIFKNSLTGSFVDKYLSFALIKVDPSAGLDSREGIGRRREREVYDAMDSRSKR